MLKKRWFDELTRVGVDEFSKPDKHLLLSFSIFVDDHTRVLLKNPHGGRPGYINANYVDVSFFSSSLSLLSRLT